MSSGNRHSPLGDQQDDLAHQEADLKRQMEQLENLIETAPQKIAEQKKRDREVLISRAARGGNRLDIPTSLRGDDLFSPRERGSQRNRPRLKSEQRAQRLRFFALFVVFASLVALLISKFL